LEAITKDAQLMTIMTENLIEGWNWADAFACGEISILGPNQTLIVQHNADSYCRDREKASVINQEH
jgi:hypothetical protein